MTVIINNPITWHIRHEKGLLEIKGVQKQVHRLKEGLFKSPEAQDVTEYLNNRNLVTNFSVLCILGISSFSRPQRPSSLTGQHEEWQPLAWSNTRSL